MLKELPATIFLEKIQQSYTQFEAIQYTGKHIAKCSFLVSSCTTILHSVVTFPYPEFLKISLLLDIFVFPRSNKLLRIIELKVLVNVRPNYPVLSPFAQHFILLVIYFGGRRLSYWFHPFGPIVFTELLIEWNWV